MWLNNAELQISPDIQRRLDPARVAEIVEKANPFVKVFREVKQEDILREVMRFTGMPKDGAYAAALAEIYDQKAASALREVG